MRFANVLLDLDGTLVDSAPAVIAAVQHALVMCGVPALVSLDDAIIGAPLLPTLRRVSGLADGAELDRLAAAFRDVYDGEGFRHTAPYGGLAVTLDALCAGGRQSFVVTNKRLIPTLRILEFLGIADRFAGVHCIDGEMPLVRDKAELVGRVLARHGLLPADSVMVGDTVADGAAAQANGVAFIAATYGYGDLLADPSVPFVARIDAFDQLPAALRGLD